MKVEAGEYETLRRWAAEMFELTFEPLPNLKPEDHPISVLDATAAGAPARARQGLAMMIGDEVEMTAAFSPEEVARLDSHLRALALPTLSEMRLRVMKAVRRIAARGAIRSDDEYFLIRNAVEALGDKSNAQEFWRLLGDYELRSSTS
ncbi:hypothetical protein GGQ87_002120 [Brevundimonas alba]|uniref:Uncharacterized protein n=1 Tax=Brevundimonas alba TaxID=74314 RepID=A0A7X6BPI8_9CAUL|nr:hypothetical protein [Brevundimonas alba]NJC41825.1 hypothetical protein [Brevundimonas alba]